MDEPPMPPASLRPQVAADVEHVLANRALSLIRGLMLLALLAFAASCSLGDDGPLEEEASLRSRFQAHRQDFDRIRELCAADSDLVRVAPDFTWLKNSCKWPRDDVGLTPERWEIYRELFTKAGVAKGVSIQEDRVFFLMSSVGLSVTGASRGVVYCREKPTPVVESLAAEHAEGMCYARIEGNWYLFQRITY